MKKIMLCLLLCGCSTIEFIPYDGQREIIGKGGLYNKVISIEDIKKSRCIGIFSTCDIEDTEYTKVDIYYNGLPKNKKCKFIGKIESNNVYDTELALQVIKLGGNVITSSDIEFNDSFLDTGVLRGGSSAGNVYTILQGNLYKYRTHHNIFECK